MVHGTSYISWIFIWCLCFCCYLNPCLGQSNSRNPLSFFFFLFKLKKLVVGKGAGRWFQIFCCYHYCCCFCSNFIHWSCFNKKKFICMLNLWNGASEVLICGNVFGFPADGFFCWIFLLHLSIILHTENTLMMLLTD